MARFNKKLTALYNLLKKHEYKVILWESNYPMGWLLRYIFNVKRLPGKVARLQYSYIKVFNYSLNDKVYDQIVSNHNINLYFHLYVPISIEYPKDRPLEILLCQSYCDAKFKKKV